MRAMENAIKTGDPSNGGSDVIRTKTGLVKKGPMFVLEEEKGRIERWASVVGKIPSSWRK